MSKKKRNKYPVSQRRLPISGRGNHIIPYQQPSINIPTTIIPKYAGKNHSVGGQISTRIHLKNSRGEEMDIFQRQQVLNLLGSDRNHWHVTSGNGLYQRRKRKP